MGLDSPDLNNLVSALQSSTVDQGLKKTFFDGYSKKLCNGPQRKSVVQDERLRDVLSQAFTSEKEEKMKRSVDNDIIVHLVLIIHNVIECILM